MRRTRSPRLARRDVEARRDDGHAEFVAHVGVDDGAEDDLGLVAGLALDDGRGLRGLADAEAGAGRDVDEHVARAGDRDAVEERAGDGFERGALGALLALRRRPSP